jgi:Uma2 family endonuclease
MAVQHFSEDEPRTGVPMSDEDFERLISAETARKYELIDGILYDMTGSTPEHSSIAGRIDHLFQLQMARSGPCRTHRDQYVAIPGHKPVCPDVVLTCNIADWSKQYRSKPFRIHSPLIVVEVLSPGSTEDYDRNGKFERYRLCETLEVYILVSQTEHLVEVFRESNNWQKEIFTDGQTIHLEQLDLEFAIDDIYEGIL